ncbi:MAG: glycosyltransferase family 2 protein [Caulobacteraceae bacterium]
MTRALLVSTSPELVGEASPQAEAEGVTISVVVPVYNEERNIRPFLARIEPVLEKIGPYEVIFALDPCSDRTEAVITEEAQRNPHIGLLVFSRRFGQPAANMAGILNCRGNWCVVIDVDLQDPPELIAELYAKAQEGFEVVTARRLDREGETALKKFVSSLGYAVINTISDVKIPRDTGDFRIISRRVMEELRSLKETHGFLRGLVSLVGFRSAEVGYRRDRRFAGVGNYNRYLGSIKIGFNGIFGFSTFPLQIMIWSGFVIAGLSAVGAVAMVIAKLLLGDSYPVGIPTITILVLFMGGVQLTALGVLGEYVGRIYEEVRERPMFIIDRAVNVDVQSRTGRTRRRSDAL